MLMLRRSQVPSVVRCIVERRRRSSAVALAAATLALTVAMIPVSSATAAPAQGAGAVPASTYPGGSGHAIANWTVSGSGSGFHGLRGDVRVNCLHVSSATTQFINQEMWLIQSPTSNYWVEVGITVGPIRTPSGTVIAKDPHYFWADSRPSGGGYWEHDWNLASEGTYEHAEIYSIGDREWKVTEAGHSSASKGNFAGAARQLEAGTESTDTTNIGEGSVSSLGYQTLTGSWVNNWNSSISGGAELWPPDSPMYNRWVTRYWWMQSGLNSCQA